MLEDSGGRIRALKPIELPWLAAASCALVTVAAIALLGPPLGHAFCWSGG